MPDVGAIVPTALAALTAGVGWLTREVWRLGRVVERQGAEVLALRESVKRIEAGVEAIRAWRGR